MFFIVPIVAQRHTSHTFHLIQGKWFDGNGFADEDFYVVDGVLSRTPPEHIDTTIDLHGRYLVPPYGDAHEHNFDSLQRTPAVTAQYLHDGIFYAQGMTDITNGAKAVASAGLVNTPSTVDVTYAHGGLTGANGHPKEVYEAIPLGFYYPETPTQREQVSNAHFRAGNAYWEIDTPADLDTKWSEIIADKPDLIKIFINESEHYSAAMHKKPPLGGGLDPALVPLIVKRAHAAGLKVAAHVETAADYHLALVSGVDELAHVPGYCIAADVDPGPYRLTDADVSLTASLRVKVVPTASFCDNEHTSAERKAATRDIQLSNLGRLKAVGAQFVIGSDNYGRDSVHEAMYLHSLGLWSNLELLRIWSTATPQDIFPERRIGKLEPGYEASFLVLRRDPIEDWAATQEIESRWKQGYTIKMDPKQK